MYFVLWKWKEIFAQNTIPENKNTVSMVFTIEIWVAITIYSHVKLFHLLFCGKVNIMWWQKKGLKNQKNLDLSKSCFYQRLASWEN